MHLSFFTVLGGDKKASYTDALPDRKRRCSVCSVVVVQCRFFWGGGRANLSEAVAHTFLFFGLCVLRAAVWMVNFLGDPTSNTSLRHRYPAAQDALLHAISTIRGCEGKGPMIPCVVVPAPSLGRDGQTSVRYPPFSPQIARKIGALARLQGPIAAALSARPVPGTDAILLSTVRRSLGKGSRSAEEQPGMRCVCTFFFFYRIRASEQCWNSSERRCVVARRDLEDRGAE